MSQTEISPRPPASSPALPKLVRFRVRNFKSIEECNVRLGGFTVLVGKNGAGKSNFLDALRFVSDAVRHSLDFAVQQRGGIDEVRLRTRGGRGGHPRDLEFELELLLADGRSANYSFLIGASVKFGYSVKKEICRIAPKEFGDPQVGFEIKEGQRVSGPPGFSPVVNEDSLYLQAIAGAPEVRPVFDALSGMGFYNLNPEVIKEVQDPDSGRILERHGKNLASTLRQIRKHDSASARRISEFLAKVVPEIIEFKPRTVIAKKETIEFTQAEPQREGQQRFTASSMSDGTLRALGILVAINQGFSPETAQAMLVGIEEPEAALHPDAARVLADALLEASDRRQIIITTHSPEILDNPSIKPSCILAVVMEGMRTRIAPVDEATRAALRDHLCTGGELLRAGQLQPGESQLIQGDLSEWF